MIDKVGLPESWQIVKLKDVCNKIIGGGTPSTNILEYWCGEIPWISSADILGTKEIVPRKKINIEAIENSTTNILPKGSIIIVTRVGLGKLAIAPYDICFSQDCQGLVLNEEILTPMYALVFLSQAVQNFKYESRGTTIKGVTKKQLSELDLSLPPIEEQKRIVSKIEELFSELDKGIESLKTAQQQLKVYRQAVLKWAFEGKLTEEWRQKRKNLTSPEEMFKKIISCKKDKTKKDKNLEPTLFLNENELQELPNLPEKWKWVKFGDICDRIFDGTHFSPQNFPEGKYKYITAKNIKEWGLDLTDITYVSEADHLQIYSRCDVKKGDVLYIKDGATTGRATVNNLDEEFSLLSSVGVFRVNGKFINPKFLAHYLNAQVTRNRMLAKIAGVAITRLTLTKLSSALFILTSLEEQNEIVQEIESRLSVCNKIEETIEQSLKQAEALRQSILKKAFEGKLVPQEPNDEPASKLLERIRATKQAPGKLATKKSKLKI